MLHERHVQVELTKLYDLQVELMMQDPADTSPLPVDPSPLNSACQLEEDVSGFERASQEIERASQEIELNPPSLKKPIPDTRLEGRKPS